MKWLVFHLNLLHQVPNSFVVMEMLDIMQDKNIMQNVFTIRYCQHPESFLNIYRFHFGLTVNNVVKGVKTVELIDTQNKKIILYF